MQTPWSHHTSDKTALYLHMMEDEKTSSRVSSGASTVTAMARVKAKAAKARLSFAEKEMKIKLEKARLEASIDMLKQWQQKQWHWSQLLMPTANVIVFDFMHLLLTLHSALENTWLSRLRSMTQSHRVSARHTCVLYPQGGFRGTTAFVFLSNSSPQRRE